MFCVVWDLLKLIWRTNNVIKKLQNWKQNWVTNTREHACHVPAYPPLPRLKRNHWAIREPARKQQLEDSVDKMDWICFQWNFRLMRCCRYEFRYLNFCIAFYTSFASLYWFWVKLTRRLSMSSAKVKKGKTALSRTWLASSPELVLWNKWRAS